jgi:hypothetical protein
MEYIPCMEWIVEFHREFSKWFEVQDDGLQDEILANLKVLAEFGPALRRPRVGNIEGSTHPQMKELIVQYKGEPWRILFAFDPKRHGILLVGGNKTGDSRWYKTNVPIADARFSEHLEELAKEMRTKVKPEKEKRK